jgi:hypothetical protein
LGYPPAQMLGRNALTFVAEDHLLMAREKLGELLRKPGGRVEASLVFKVNPFSERAKSGKYVYLYVVGVNLLHDPALKAIEVAFLPWQGGGGTGGGNGLPQHDEDEDIEDEFGRRGG